MSLVTSTAASRSDESYCRPWNTEWNPPKQGRNMWDTLKRRAAQHKTRGTIIHTFSWQVQRWLARPHGSSHQLLNEKKPHCDPPTSQNYFLVPMFVLKLNSSKMMMFSLQNPDQLTLSKSIKSGVCKDDGELWQVLDKRTWVTWPLPDGSCQHFCAQNPCVILWVPPAADAGTKVQGQAVSLGGKIKHWKGVGNRHRKECY